MEMLNSEFNEISQDTSCPDLFPSELQPRINELNDYIADKITFGVYKCGFSDSQVLFHSWPSLSCYHCDGLLKAKAIFSTLYALLMRIDAL